MEKAQLILMVLSVLTGAFPLFVKLAFKNSEEVQQAYSDPKNVETFITLSNLFLSVAVLLIIIDLINKFDLTSLNL